MVVFAESGAQHFPGVLSGGDVDRLRELADRCLVERPGARLTQRFEALPALTEMAQSLIGPSAQAVRAVVFDKSETRNWAVAWHQDRTILVKARREVDGFGPWSAKQGQLHVVPPIELLAGMATLRVHLDPCGPDNAPLSVALGSHRFGRVAAAEAASRAATCEILTCLAQSGDVWAYVTPILHASARAAQPARRRVLQLDFAACDLPGGLEWLGLN